jgi:hypothetical protein
MKNLLISGQTLQEWCFDEIITKKNNIDPVERLSQYHFDNQVGRYTDSLTYLEVEIFNNNYKNFK